MSKQSIKQTIDDNIYQNGQQRITGVVMNSVLKEMVDNEYTELNQLASKVDEVEKVSDYVKPLMGLDSGESADVIINPNDYEQKQLAISDASIVNVDLTSITDTLGLIYPEDADGTWRQWGGYYFKVISVTPNAQITITPGARPYRYTCLKSFTSVVANQSPDYCEGFTSWYPTALSVEKTFIAPSDCNILLVQSQSGGNDNLPSAVKVGVDSMWKGWNGYGLIAIQATSGEKFKITANSSYASRFVCLKSFEPTIGETPDFCDGVTTWTTLSASASTEIEIPTDCSFLVIQTLRENNNVTPSEIKKLVEGTIYDIKKDIESLIPNSMPLDTIDSNLRTDNINRLPQDIIVRRNDGTRDMSWYGKDGAIYNIPLPSSDKYHIFVKFKFNGKLPNNEYRTFADFFNVRCQYIQRNPRVQGQGVIENSFFWSVNESSQSVYGNFWQPINGLSAFAVRFLGDADDVANHDVIMTMADDSIVIKHKNGANIHSISVSKTESVYSVIKKLKALTSVDVLELNALGYTYGDLLFNANVEIPMVSQLTPDESGTHTGQYAPYWDNPYMYVPIAKDSKTHTLECIVDKTSNSYAVAFDGLTFVGTSSTMGDTLVLGYNGLPITFYDLHIGIGSFEDAEIVTNPIKVSGSPLKQLISNHNPKLIIWEGHSIDVCLEGDEVSSDMVASTDRLFSLFEILKQRGYVPVTWKQIIDWKINDKPLPKRCYNIMMDDWQVANFMDYERRMPFMRYNVNAGLAIIENAHELDDEVTFDGVTYTARECYQTLVREGWHPCSHAKHQLLSHIKASELPLFLKECSQTDLQIGIYSDIMVYPQGAVANTNASLQNSSYKLGVMVVTNEYNCKAKNNFYLGRDEIGKRQSWQNVLNAIV